MTRFEALKAAVERAGTQSAFAKEMDVTQPTVWRWLRQSKQLPAEYVLRAEQLFGISRHDLRPDIYPREVPNVPAAFIGVDADNRHVSFNGSSVSQGNRV